MRTHYLTAFLLLSALVFTDLCNGFGFVDPPKHRRLRGDECIAAVDTLPNQTDVNVPKEEEVVEDEAATEETAETEVKLEPKPKPKPVTEPVLTIKEETTSPEPEPVTEPVLPIKEETVLPEPRAVVKEEESEPVLTVNPETTLPEPEELVAKAPEKDQHVKIIVHSNNNCSYCAQMLNTLKAFEDKYEIIEEKHNGYFRPSYSYYYVTTFPYVEYLYDGKVKLYHYGLRTEDQVRRLIEQISK